MSRYLELQAIRAERGITEERLFMAMRTVADYLLGVNDGGYFDHQRCADLLQWCLGGHRYDVETGEVIDWEPRTSFRTLNEGFDRVPEGEE